MSWFLVVLRKYATFSGRARRREYWAYILTSVFLLVLLLLIDMLTGTFDFEFLRGLLSSLFLLGNLLPALAVSVRRLHDTDRSGWWLLIGLLPPLVIGFLPPLLIALVPLICTMVLFYFLIQEGDEGPNRHGPDPKSGR